MNRITAKQAEILLQEKKDWRGREIWKSDLPPSIKIKKLVRENERILGRVADLQDELEQHKMWLYILLKPKADLAELRKIIAFTK